MNGVQLYNLRYYLEQLHRRGLSWDEGKRLANHFIDAAGGDYDQAGAAMTADLERRQREGRAA